MNYVVATVRAKQKPNLVRKQRCQFLFLCLFCCTFTSMIPFTTLRSFFLFFEGWFQMLLSLSTIYLAYHLAVAHTVGISLFSSPSRLLLFSPFAQIPLQSKSRMDLFHLCYSSLRGSFFLGKAVSSTSRVSPAPCLQSRGDLCSFGSHWPTPSKAAGHSVCLGWLNVPSNSSSTVLPAHFRGGRDQQNAWICISD